MGLLDMGREGRRAIYDLFVMKELGRAGQDIQLAWCVWVGRWLQRLLLKGNNSSWI